MCRTKRLSQNSIAANDAKDAANVANTRGYWRKRMRRVWRGEGSGEQTVAQHILTWLSFLYTVRHFYCVLHYLCGAFCLCFVAPFVCLSVYLYFLLFIWTFLQFLFLQTITASTYIHIYIYICNVRYFALIQTRFNSNWNPNSSRVQLMLPLCVPFFVFPSYAFSTS